MSLFLSNALFLSLAALAILFCSPAEGATTASPPSAFVQAIGTDFVLNGSKLFFNGFNSYWMMHVASRPTQRYKVTVFFREAAASGLSVCRAWAFSDGGDYSYALQLSPGVYNEAVFQALDFVISEAAKFGVRLILSLVNNYHDFGGRSQYVDWARSAGLSLTSDDDFYTDQVVKGYYKDHLKKVLTRMNTVTGVAYKDDATIMAWELINEPRCQVDFSGRTLNGWVEEMAAYIKSIDSNHLLSIGMEGFYGDSVPERKQHNPQDCQFGTDFISNHLVNGIDFSTIHFYPEWVPGKSKGELMEFVRRWIRSHWEDSRRILKKPLVLEEFGISKKDRGYSNKERDSFMNSVYTCIYDLARDGGTISGGLLWQLMAPGMDSLDDGYEVVLSRDHSTATLVALQSQRMTALSNSRLNQLMQSASV